MDQPGWEWKATPMVHIQNSCTENYFSCIYYHKGVNVKWLGLHFDDVLGPNTTVASSALQNWSPPDQRTFTKVMSVVEEQEHPRFVQELRLMGEHRVKAEIESLNAETFDALETLIIQKILRKTYL